MHLVIVLGYILLALFFGCSEVQNPTDVDPVQKAQGDRQGQLTRALVNDLINPEFENLNREFSSLHRGVETYCAEGGELSFGLLSQWQNHWHQAVASFHYLNVLVYGPLTISQDSSPLRFIYSRPPRRGHVLIEREIQKASELKESYEQVRPLAHSLGFQALEYLLFRRPELQTDPFDEATCHYSRYVLQDLQVRLNNYQNQWQTIEVSHVFSPEGQTRLSESIGRLAGHVVNHTREVLYRGSALGPLGLDPELSCGSPASCFNEYGEHPFANDPKVKLSAGLRALNDLFNGRELQNGESTYSLRDYFFHLQNAKPHPLDRFKDLMRSWQEMPSFKSNLSSGSDVEPYDLAFAQEFLDHFERVNFWLSTDLLVDLNANLPKSVQGDND